ncbi:MAG: hypothetical protein PHE59_03585 [Patescibacteria group bacterium]|nr:hypothetical protein [Patescibacteria group bacterium]MDD5164527.1 hypothetical protein [Patescibacteria group bacterium]MDD5534731.1 hypothetical protein [Patescibacteria group bacterium]
MSLDKVLRNIQKSKFWKDKKITPFIYSGLFLNIITWLIVLIFHGRNGQISLHYNILSGVDSIGHWSRLLEIPLVGLAILILNSFLVFYFYLHRKNNLIYFLLAGLLAVQIILLISVLLIINL